jgi:phosphohistidine phosphatase
MLKLILVRHAKSSWDDPDLMDFDRPLAPRGQAAAPVMGQYMAARGHHPDRVLCSTARRTRETFALMLPSFSEPFEAIFTRDLYETPASAYLDLIRRQGGVARTLMIIGHNPALEELGPALVGVNNVDHGRMHASAKYPTGAVAVMQFEAATWADIQPGSARGVSFTRPRDLMGTDVDSD